MSPLVILIAAMAAIAIAAWFLWPQISAHFADSETIFWARLQVFAGAVWTAIEQADLSSIFSALGYGRYLGIALVVMGAVTELARRSRATDLGAPPDGRR
jgi:hypothetical protein